MCNNSGFKEISFNIQGEFITQIVREQFYTGEKSYEKAIELLMDCMSGTNTPETQLKRYAEDILIGRAALKGSTEEGTYHLEIYEPEEYERLPNNMNIWNEVEKRKKSEEKLKNMIKRWNAAIECIPESYQREIRKQLGEDTEEDRQQDMIDSFMTRMKDTGKHSTEDYGWLEPNGTFHAVEWGNHQEWASKYLLEQFQGRNINLKYRENPGDKLCEIGWVLLHNPSHGIAIPTKDTSKEYTKLQKEFLYDYYMERNCYEEANSIWQE